MSEETKVYETRLAKANNTYLGMIESQLDTHEIKLSGYGKNCVINAIAAINELLSAQGLDFGSDDLDKGTLTTALISVATLELNAKATNREVYFLIRNKSVKSPDGKGTKWVKQIELNLEGDAHETLAAKYGRNVKTIYPFWVVRENDDFKYPRMKGLEMLPPEWEAKGEGKIVRVVYPVLMEDNTVNFYIAERTDVVNNLKAHIRNNLMNETFGICADRFKATPEEKATIEKKKNELSALLVGKDIEAIIATAELQPYISPAWLDSTEAMVLRKLRNTVCKKIPKDFGKNYFVQDIYEKSNDPIYVDVVNEIEENQNALPLGIVGETPNATPDF
jgi:hypothetical protein